MLMTGCPIDTVGARCSIVAQAPEHTQMYCSIVLRCSCVALHLGEQMQICIVTESTLPPAPDLVGALGASLAILADYVANQHDSGILVKDSVYKQCTCTGQQEATC